MGLGASLPESSFPVISKDFGPAQREEILARLSHEVYDILVIGGGITGAAIARDAAHRGLKVLLVEKDDFASGTSSRSSKLVHGGVRYLEQYEFKLVFEATRERARLWKLAPHLVTPLPFVFPCFQKSRVPLWKLNLGVWLYDILSLFRSPTIHRRWGKDETLKNEPQLRSNELVGSIFYWDGATDDARLTLANILDAREGGADCLSRVNLTQIQFDKSDKHEHLITLQNSLNRAQYFHTKAKVVISSAGPWTDSLLKNLGHNRPKLLAPTRGSHIVVPFKKLPSKHAVVIFHPKDGRVLFTIPFGDFTVLGTTDEFDGNSPDSTHITAQEVDYLIAAAKEYFPKAEIKKDDITSTWAGLRPLLAPPDKASASQISREHHIEWIDPALLVIAGGKLTTHREMAEQCVDRALLESQNWNTPLGNSKSSACKTHNRVLPKTLYSPLNSPVESSVGTSESSRFDKNTLEGILKTQMVLSLEDFMVRRTQIYYKEAQNGLELLPQLKSSFLKILLWDESKWNSEVENYKNYLRKNVWEPLGRSAP